MTRRTVEDIKRDEMFPTYVGCMRKVLAELAGWSAERVDASIEQSLQNPGFRGFFMHDTPASDAAWSLIPEPIRSRVVGLDLVTLHRRVWHAIELQGVAYNVFPHEDPSYDWQAARQRIADILREYDNAA